MLLRRLKYFIVSISFLFSCQSWSAGKFDLMAGAYTLDATVAEKAYKKTGLGSYRISYLYPFFQKFEFFASYNMTVAQVISGDYGYGFDVGSNYFPISFAGKPQYNKDGISLVVFESIKPYLSFGFTQRSFQSVKTSYAGFVFGIGFEKSLTEKTNLKFEIRRSSISGGSDATAEQIDILAGVAFFI